MIKTIHTTLVICFSTLLLFQCEAKTEHRNKAGLTEEESKTILTGILVNTGYSNTASGTVLDNQNGLEWKKCTQGQVFRSTQNDCQGSGQAGPGSTVDINKYGAVTKNYCPLNTHACNATSLPQALNGASVNGVFSEAFDTCSKDRTGGYTNWRVPTYPELLKLAQSGQNMLAQYFPNTVEEKYWSSWGNESDLMGVTARAVSFHGSSIGEETIMNKDIKAYVRCIRNTR